MSAQTNRINFTKDNIEALIPPRTGRAEFHDSHQRASGLQLRITAGGTKTFCIFRRIRGGAPERVTLGRYPQMTIEQARRQAALISAAIAEGQSPASAKRAHRSERTFADLFADYLKRHAKPKKRSWADDLQRYEQYLRRPLGNKKLSTMDRKAVAAIHSNITVAGHPTVANRVLALISGVFGWAIDAGVCESNPAKGIKRNREISRDRFLQSDELPRFFAALEVEPNETMRDYFWISLLTGARRSNVLSMKWSDINFERAEWRIEQTKNGTPQTLPLSPEAVRILEGRWSEVKSEFVFSGRGKSGHLAEPKTAWLRVLDRANIANLRIHDLRRTFGSWQAKSGSSLVTIAKSLNHKSLATTAVYARLDIDPVRSSVITATDAMLAAGKPKAVLPRQMS